jgi:GNAT superfamily N-acetyltransferase
LISQGSTLSPGEDAIPYYIRLARTADLPLLPEIERAAATLFSPYGLAELFGSQLTPEEVLEGALAAGLLWVAADRHDNPVGFALADELAGSLHLDELDVLPEHGRRGLGTRLVEAVCLHARMAGFPAVTLTTLEHVPWNAPFYQRLGFRILPPPELPAELRDLLQEEISRGLPSHGRVAMRLELSPQ